MIVVVTAAIVVLDVLDVAVEVLDVDAATVGCAETFVFVFVGWPCVQGDFVWHMLLHAFTILGPAIWFVTRGKTNQGAALSFKPNCSVHVQLCLKQGVFQKASARLKLK